MSLRKVFTLTFVLTLVLCSAAYAVEFNSRGSVVIPGVQFKHTSATNFSEVYLHVTNIAGCDVDCRVTFYDHAGNDVTSSYAAVYKGSDTSSGAVLVTSGGDFSLPSGGSRYVKLSVDGAAKLLVGHAVVEWASTNAHVKKALVVSGRYYFSKNGVSFAKLPVIGSQPF